MSRRNSASDFPEEQFEQWLKTSRIQPRKGFQARLRKRMQDEENRIDAELDHLFQLNNRFHDPKMSARIRARLQEHPPQAAARPVDWFRWMAPLSAAAVLTMAFVSFQFKAPSPSPALTVGSPPAALRIIEDPLEEDSMTEIFALASTLNETADLSRLKSVDDLALLFD